MVRREDKQRVQTLLQETMTLLCKNGLQFRNKFCIEALVGITLDDDEEFHFSVKQTIQEPICGPRSPKRSRYEEERQSVNDSGIQRKRRRRDCHTTDELEDNSFHTDYANTDSVSEDFVQSQDGLSVNPEQSNSTKTIQKKVNFTAEVIRVKQEPGANQQFSSTCMQSGSDDVTAHVPDMSLNDSSVSGAAEMSKKMRGGPDRLGGSGSGVGPEQEQTADELPPLILVRRGGPNEDELSYMKWHIISRNGIFITIRAAGCGLSVPDHSAAYRRIPEAMDQLASEGYGRLFIDRNRVIFGKNYPLDEDMLWQYGLTPWEYWQKSRRTCRLISAKLLEGLKASYEGYAEVERALLQPQPQPNLKLQPSRGYSERKYRGVRVLKRENSASKNRRMASVGEVPVAQQTEDEMAALALRNLVEAVGKNAFTDQAEIRELVVEPDSEKTEGDGSSEGILLKILGEARKPVVDIQTVTLRPSVHHRLGDADKGLESKSRQSTSLLHLAMHDYHRMEPEVEQDVPEHAERTAEANAEKAKETIPQTEL